MKKRSVRTDRNDATPRYLQIAESLRREIAGGRYPVGAQLPTEHELCEQLSVSRFTIREALRVLASAGLVRRKTRAGTSVVALPDDTRYSQSIASLPDLLQYAKSTDFRYAYIGRIGLSKAQAKLMGAAAGEEWIYAVAIRRDHAGGDPIGLTRVYLNPALKGIEHALRRSKSAIYSLVEREFGVRIERVEQVIAGIAIGEEDAANLDVPAGGPGLSIRRSYFDAGGHLVELADNVHPSSRFTYRVELRRRD